MDGEDEDVVSELGTRRQAHGAAVALDVCYRVAQEVNSEIGGQLNQW